nr:MAG TPA: hypothetical protein [Caudoviricetes sp.]
MSLLNSYASVGSLSMESFEINLEYQDESYSVESEGDNIFQKMWNGIKAFFKWIKDKIVQFGKWIGGLFGITSKKVGSVAETAIKAEDALPTPAKKEMKEAVKEMFEAKTEEDISKAAVKVETIKKAVKQAKEEKKPVEDVLSRTDITPDKEKVEKLAKIVINKQAVPISKVRIKNEDRMKTLLSVIKARPHDIHTIVGENAEILGPLVAFNYLKTDRVVYDIMGVKNFYVKCLKTIGDLVDEYVKVIRSKQINAFAEDVLSMNKTLEGLVKQRITGLTSEEHRFNFALAMDVTTKFSYTEPAYLKDEDKKKYPIGLMFKHIGVEVRAGDSVNDILIESTKDIPSPSEIWKVSNIASVANKSLEEYSGKVKKEIERIEKSLSLIGDLKEIDVKIVNNKLDHMKNISDRYGLNTSDDGTASFRVAVSNMVENVKNLILDINRLNMNMDKTYLSAIERIKDLAETIREIYVD